MTPITTNRLALILALVSIAVLALAAAGTAQADDPAALDGFGVATFDGKVADLSGGGYPQAGGHPATASTVFRLNTRTDPNQGAYWPEEPVRDVLVDVPPGLIGKVAGIPTCSMPELVGVPTALGIRGVCPTASQVGVVANRFATFVGGGLGPGLIQRRPVFAMETPPGIVARFGFNLLSTIVVLDVRLRTRSDYGLTIDVHGIPEGVALNASEFTFWGVPSDSAHDPERACPGTDIAGCASSQKTPQPFLRNPTSCPPPGVGVTTTIHADSWFHPGARNPDGLPDPSDSNWSSAAFESHNPPGDALETELAPAQWGAVQGPSGCREVPVKGDLSARPTALDTETPSGLNVTITVPNPGLDNPAGLASSDIKAVKVTLPEGVTLNPSQAEGLGVCTPAQYASTELSFHPTPGKGCPDDSKIGSVTVHTPLIEEAVEGDVYIAAPHDNPFDSLLALYIVLKNPERGILIKLAGLVDPNERTGQIVVTFNDNPQVPFSSFDFHFREGARAPLVTPPTCGTYTTEAQFTPWSDPAHPITSTSDFQIIHGIGGGPCPSGGLPPFKPGLIAGSINNNAGSYSPFDVRLFRSDEEQEITHFSIKLPPGLLGKLAGIPFCSEAAIEAAKTRTGAQELASPSCPAASEVGTSLAGAGVGSVLAYAPGKIYLAGPYHGSLVSIAAITAAKVGPFDLGTVVVRQALKVNPETAEVFIDATGSDPIPHIIDGVTTHLRDVIADVDRPDFTLNPTSCDPTSTASTLLGSGLDFSSAADDLPVTVSTRYQAANCANLPFAPKLALSLKGATHRAANPAFRAVLTMKPGEANIARAEVTLPKSEFIDNSHIRTVCTRVQFAAGAGGGAGCPPDSIYGHATAYTPLLDQPLEGPVYLRSNPEHTLPDLLAALHSDRIDIDLAGHVDSIKGGRVRNTFEVVPDAPVSRFVLEMAGGKKGLLENSANLCAAKQRAIVKFDGQNGKAWDTTPIVKPQCGSKAKKRAKR